MKAASMLAFFTWHTGPFMGKREELNFVRCQYNHRSNKILW